MRRLVWVALAASAACSDVSKLPAGPVDGFYRPTGLGVYGGKLVVASSNADLLYDPATGGSVITVDPAVNPASWIGGLNVQSFAGQLAIADPNDPRDPALRCPAIPGPLALVPTRGVDQLYLVGLAANGAPSCAGCATALTGGQFADAYSVGVECGATTARAYVGYLRGVSAAAWVTQVDLTTSPPTLRSNSFGVGQMLGFAYDPARKRLYAAQSPQGIRWVDLLGGCAFDVAEVDGGCHGGAAALPSGLDVRGIVLSRPPVLGFPPPRVYVLARVYDAQATTSLGLTAGDVDGVLLVMEPVDDLAGQTHLQLVKPPIRVGYGPVSITRLPGRAGKRDVIAALALEDPVLLLFDDDNDAQVVIGRDVVVTGHPWVGSQPFGLAVDPVPTAGGAARVYVGSYAENFVTEIDVPLANIDQTQVPPLGGFRRITGGTR